MDGEQHIVPYVQQESRDYDDALEPGYRFRPTDLELIVYYLKRKIELGEHHGCRIYDVHVYGHHPEELTERYRSCEGKWYFFTTREAKYPKGTRVNRRTKDFGHWKSTQKQWKVYDFVTKRVIGTKRSLVFRDEKNQKTSWLMHEYTYNDPNLPNGSNVNKITDWVLCTIYKKESNRANNHNNQLDQQVQNTRNQEEIQQQNQLDDEPSPAKRPRVLINQPSENVQHYETNHQMGTDVKMMTYVGSMFQSSHQSTMHNIVMGSGQLMFPTQALGISGYNYGTRSNINTAPITAQPLAAFQDPNQEQVQSFNGSSKCEHYDQNQSMSATTNVENTYQEDSQTLVNMQSGYNGSMDDATDDGMWDQLAFDELCHYLNLDEDDITPSDE